MRVPAVSFSLLTGFSFALLACGSTTPAATPDNDAGTTPSDTLVAEVGDETAVDDVGPSACAARDEKLQVALDGARKKANNALFAVKDEPCGVKVFLSGDAKNASLTSLWRIGSVTKTFVSAVILSLDSEGKLAIGDPLSKWVEGVPKTDGVTVRMLLNHTSGIFNYTEATEFFTDLKHKWTPREIVDMATKNDPYFAPGDGWHYSNTNYVLLGMIAEKAGGAKIGALVRARALTKAGLANTFFDGEEPVVGTMTKGFSSGGTTDVTFQLDMSGPWAAGAMVSDGVDLVKWAASLYGTDAVLDAKARAKLVESPASGGAYGLGIGIIPAKSSLGFGEMIGHGGDINGFHTMMFWSASKKTAVAAIVNRDGTNPNDILLATLPVLAP